MNINSLRKFKRNDTEPNENGEYVLYWMQINRRLHYNYALEYAIAWANKLGKPLLIYEALKSDYPWASARTHHFITEGMAEHNESIDKRSYNYYPYLESEPGEGRGLLKSLCEKACLLVSDEYPVYIIREHNESIQQKIDIPFHTIDSNGIIPLGLTEKAPYSAYFFRKIMQKNFVEAYTNPPKENPLNDLENRSQIDLNHITQKWPDASDLLKQRDTFIQELPVRQDISKLEIQGTRSAALKRMNEFISKDLMAYDDDRNDPDLERTSRLSPWLHLGKISEYEIVKAVFEQMPKNWDVASLKSVDGKNRGFFKAEDSVEGFLDEVITWREVGFHFAHHEPNYDKFESLPDWTVKTLEDHDSDPREYTYSYEEFEQALTHDPIWNAAQRQLVSEGRIHNYLRMLWGKKILHWTPDSRTALKYLIDLNNWYAIDGRDPNSYSGIFWTLGRFDRPWGPEREIFGKVRYMTSASTEKKVKLKVYLERYKSKLFD